MIKQTAIIHRLPRLSKAAFLDHWRNIHAPLVLSLAADLGIRRYIQLSPLADGSPLSKAIGVECDGMAEVWFDSVEAVLSGKNSPNARAAMKRIKEDEARFIDGDRMHLFWGQENQIL